MSYLNRTVLLAGVAAFFVAASAHAQSKLAIVNMKTVFDGYWKTKQSNATVKEREAKFKTKHKKMEED
jgi:Skp family chaperone for outer membrane proteins